MKTFLMLFFSLMAFMLSATSVVVKAPELTLNYDNDVGICMPIVMNNPTMDNQVFIIDNYTNQMNTPTQRVIGILSTKENYLIYDVVTVAVESANIGYIIDSFDQISNNYRGYTFGDINILDRNVA